VIETDDMFHDPSIRLAAIEPMVFRVPIDIPVRTAFGIMHSRPALLVRVVGTDGVEGWGEVWCNFPAFGAEHRAQLIAQVIAPLMVQRQFGSPGDVFQTISASLGVLSIQSGEPGPVAQAIAGIDIALWDMLGRRHGISVQRLLGDGFQGRVPAYASGINPDRPEQVVAQCIEAGHRAFKLKVGFGEDVDLSNLRTLRQMLGPDGTLMADANQAWGFEQALTMATHMESFDLQWLEEPMRSDAPPDQWLMLSRHISTPLAAGENLRGDEFDAAIEAPALGVIQPDIGKWGGFSGCLPVARRALATGKRFCPHWLGGGIGLVASAHLLAIAGGDGMVEVDANPNPLRTLVHPAFAISDGHLTITENPGLGVVPLIEDMRALTRQ
jgi:L-alanine-DL-glutamate epimerase-like enolase superfamily enzyme